MKFSYEKVSGQNPSPMAFLRPTILMAVQKRRTNTGFGTIQIRNRFGRFDINGFYKVTGMII